MDNKELRGTGRSQRDVVRALSQAIMGKHVLFVSMTPEAGKEHFALALGWLEANGFFGDDGCEVEAEGNYIRMGVGSVLFSMGKSISGPSLHKIQHIIEDHFVTECTAERERVLAERVKDLDTVERLLNKHGYTSVRNLYATPDRKAVLLKLKG